VGISSLALSYSGMTDSLTGSVALSLSGSEYVGSISGLGSSKTYFYSLIATDAK